MTENLRRDGRIEARIRVRVLRGKTSFAVEASDVSFRGLFLEATEAFALRSLMRLRIVLPVREIEAHAMTVRVTDKGVGVEFFGLAGPDRVAWDDFVRERLQEKRAQNAKDAKAADANPDVRTPEPPRATSEMRISPRAPRKPAASGD